GARPYRSGRPGRDADAEASVRSDLSALERRDAGDVAADHQTLNVRRAVGHGHHARVAEQLFDRVFGAEAVGAEDFHRTVRDAYAHLRRVPLRHRGLRVAALAGVEQREAAIDEKARGVEVHSHFGDLDLDALMGGDGL